MPTPEAVARLHRALDRLTPALRRDVTRALARLRARLTEARLVRLIEQGDEFALRAAMAGFEADLAATSPRITVAVRTGALAAYTALPDRIREQMAFNVTNRLATRAAGSRSSARLVREVTDETKQAIRTVVRRAFQEQITPRDTAKLIRPLIGLTQRQALAVVRRRFERLAQGHDAASVAADAERYAARLLTQRARLIARTEIIRASVTGQLDLWRTATDRGLLGADMWKRWIVTDDDRLCPICRAMTGRTVPREANFRVGGRRGGSVAGPPAHPACRCAIGLVRRAASRRVAA